MKTSFNRIFAWLAVALAAVGLGGCDVAEDMAECQETLSITFKFTKDGQDRFGTDVSSIALFVFDAQNLLVGRWDENDQSKLINGYTMTLPLEEGTYNLVAWGGINADEYTVLNTRLATSGDAGLVAGQTSLADLLVKLQATDSDNQVGYIPVDQFYGSQLNVGLVKGGSATIIDLTKNTNQIELTILGLPGSNTRATTDQYSLSFTSPNGNSTFYNNLQGNSYSYSMHNQNSPQQGELYADIHTMRMVFGNGHQFTIRDNQAGTDFYQADLLEDYIRKVFTTQAAVDANDAYQVTIAFEINEGEASVSTTVTVNGWIVAGPGSDIQ